jgi:hypothetical protein
LESALSSRKSRPLQPWQFWTLIGGLVVSGVVALVVLAGVANPHHGTCPSVAQHSRPSAQTCYPAYLHNSGDNAGVVG